MRLGWGRATGSFKSRGEVLLLILGVGSQVFHLLLCFITDTYIPSLPSYVANIAIYIFIFIVIIIIRFL